MMVEKIPQHRHCHSCGRAFTGSDRFCSDPCRQDKEGELKAKKKQLMTLWVLAMAVLVIALVVGL
ncbi:MAG: DUF2116 family Zn-ribbon domain-containing protein [Candidatus Methanomethylophilaceae archaeon]|nr:DUF2116 family Zn-ribbon domain-containing protein [Candidatus Methanomethylophilaceae archaeon]